MKYFLYFSVITLGLMGYLAFSTYQDGKLCPDEFALFQVVENVKTGELAILRSCSKHKVTVSFRGDRFVWDKNNMTAASAKETRVFHHFMNK